MAYPIDTTIYTDGANFDFKVVYRIHNDLFNEADPGMSWSSPAWVMRDMNVGGADVVELMHEDHYPDPKDPNYTMYSAMLQARVPAAKMAQFIKWYQTQANVTQTRSIGLLSRIIRYFNTYDGEITLE